MKEKRGYSYIKVPVSMIPMIYRGYASLIDILLYGMCHIARNIEPDPDNVTKRILYTFLYGKKKSLSLPLAIHRKLMQMEQECSFIGFGDDYRGFLPDGVTFYPTDEDDNSVIDRLDEVFEEDSGLWNLAREYYQVSHAFELLGLSYNGVFEHIANTYNRLKHHNYCNAWGYLKVQNLMNLISKRDDVTPEELEVFAAAAALKGIMGKRTVWYAETKLILARMAGMVKADEPLNGIDDEEAKRVYKKYSDKDNFRRLKGRLREGYVKYIDNVSGCNRLGTFFSFSRDLSVADFNKAIGEIVAERRKTAARSRKRKERHYKKLGCRPSQSENLNVHEDKAASEPQKEQKTHDVQPTAGAVSFDDIVRSHQVQNMPDMRNNQYDRHKTDELPF